ncbi:ABC transporter ATP-binding protein [Spiroplasma culicicola]|uniref:ABC transporter ATP-binding protein n=1 Tax=Spiroplasma culicicola AES-1 TaxID=1276246 RepID=W6AH71_9MOLU|nr:ABC transporter ATP-binding protein [Spiroplasma culicicola]AHI53034.1 ABC transporter ATP-binding protein [Spiroplasma culicicola AES-1]
MIKINDLSIIFKNQKGIRNINLAIANNKITGFIGNNGAGKTTTIKAILNQFKVNPGQIEVDFGENSNISDIAFFPDQNNFPKDFNIVEFAQYSASLKFISKEVYSKNIEEWLDILQLDSYRKNKFKELSSGLQKRALLLSIMVCEPKFVIFDEPTANLDVESKVMFLDLIKKIYNDLKIGVLITSHNLDELENLINHVIFINDGEIKFDGSFNKEDSKLYSMYKQYINTNSTSIKFDKINLRRK